MMIHEAEVRLLLGKILPLADADRPDSREDLRRYGLDSLNCMELLIALEDTFAITVPDDRLGIKYMHNIHDICKLIEEAS